MTQAIGIIDYGMGNLRSVQKGLNQVGFEADILKDPDSLTNYTKLVLPGVGAFGDAMKHLHERHLVEPIKQHVGSGKLLLGICLGLHLLLENSEEDPGVEGLCLIPGTVKAFDLDDPSLKIPQMGWNGIQWLGKTPKLLDGIPNGSQVYFVHGYYAAPGLQNVVMATTDYGGPFCSAVEHENIMATQFHPEKSQTVGLRILKNYGLMKA